MSKLPKAPLLEVIFELKWDITNKADIVDFQYLHGDLYSSLKTKYSHRENLIPPEVPIEVVKGAPVFRYRESHGSYPLVQIGPGLISINTIDNKYYWEEFLDEAKFVLNTLNNIYPKYKELNLSPALTYIDFYEYDKKHFTPIEFINSNLQLEVSEKFLNISEARLNDVNWTFNYQIKDNVVSLNLQNGKVNNDKDGIVSQIKVIGKKEKYNSDELVSWLESTHELSSNLFKSLTNGTLYESFKK